MLKAVATRLSHRSLLRPIFRDGEGMAAPLLHAHLISRGSTGRPPCTILADGCAGAHLYRDTADYRRGRRAAAHLYYLLEPRRRLLTSRSYRGGAAAADTKRATGAGAQARVDGAEQETCTCWREHDTRGCRRRAKQNASHRLSRMKRDAREIARWRCASR